VLAFVPRWKYHGNHGEHTWLIPRIKYSSPKSRGTSRVLAGLKHLLQSCDKLLFAAHVADERFHVVMCAKGVLKWESFVISISPVTTTAAQRVLRWRWEIAINVSWRQEPRELPAESCRAVIPLVAPIPKMHVSTRGAIPSVV